MSEFDPFLFLSWFVPTTISAIIGAFYFVAKSSWRRGKVESKTEGSASLNQTMVTNAIREIEAIKVDLKSLVTELQNQKIANTRVEERITYMNKTLESIQSDIKNISRNVQSYRDRDDEDSRDR